LEQETCFDKLNKPYVHIPAGGDSGVNKRRYVLKKSNCDSPILPSLGRYIRLWLTRMGMPRDPRTDREDVYFV
jgi:hypothetical protein